jgi:hypothetical protein
MVEVDIIMKRAVMVSAIMTEEVVTPHTAVVMVEAAASEVVEITPADSTLITEVDSVKEEETTSMEEVAIMITTALLN